MTKRVMPILAAFGLAALSLASLGAANPGVVFEFEVKDLTSDAPAQKMTASVEGDLLKVDMVDASSNAPGSMIFRGDRREMIMVEHGSKSYVVMDEATIKQLAAQIGTAMSQMREMMAQMPPEQRAAMEEMMRGRGMAGAMGPPPAPTELRRTGETAEQSGYPTVKYEVLREGRKIREHWVAEWTSMPGAQEVKAAFEGMAGFAKQLMDAVAESGLGAQMNLDMYAQMQQMNGYPIVTVDFDDNGQPQSETRLLSASEQTIAASAFEPPDGYRRQTMGGMGSR